MRQEKARLIVLDIETYRTRNEAVIERIRQEQYERACPVNKPKEEKFAWNTTAGREARVAEALDKTACDPLLAEVLCCVYQADGKAQGSSCFYDEADGLLDAANALDALAGPETVWCGHNLAGFDLPVLLNRWRRYELCPPEHFPVFHGGRWRGRVWDTMLRTPCKNGLGLVSLDDVCLAYGMGAAKSVAWRGTPMDGSRVGEAYEAGEYDLILEYCMADVAVQEALYYRQTANDTWGTFDARHDVAERLAEIDDSGLSEGARAIAKLQVLEGAGLVPRVA